MKIIKIHCKKQDFLKFKWSAWKWLDCRILHQIPQRFWGPWPPAIIAPRSATRVASLCNPPLEIPVYGPAMNTLYIHWLSDVKSLVKMLNLIFYSCNLFILGPVLPWCMQFKVTVHVFRRIWRGWLPSMWVSNDLFLLYMFFIHCYYLIYRGLSWWCGCWIYNQWNWPQRYNCNIVESGVIYIYRKKTISVLPLSVYRFWISFITVQVGPVYWFNFHAMYHLWKKVTLKSKQLIALFSRTLDRVIHLQNPTFVLNC